MKQLRLAVWCLPALLMASTAMAQTKPIDLSLGWNYADNNEGDGFASVNGWYGTLVWEVTRRVGLSFSHESYWGPYHRSGTNEHVYLGGLNINFRKEDHRFIPFVQPFGGVTRASGGGVVEEQPTFELAAGADIKLKGKLSLEVIPGEYTLAFSNGKPLSTYQAAAGIAYKFGK